MLVVVDLVVGNREICERLSHDEVILGFDPFGGGETTLLCCEGVFCSPEGSQERCRVLLQASQAKKQAARGKDLSSCVELGQHLGGRASVSGRARRSAPRTRPSDLIPNGQKQVRGRLIGLRCLDVSAKLAHRVGAGQQTCGSHLPVFVQTADQIGDLERALAVNVDLTVGFCFEQLDNRHQLVLVNGRRVPVEQTLSNSSCRRAGHVTQCNGMHFGDGVPKCGTLVRAPRSVLLLLVLVIVGLAVYGYFTTPLPLGLSSVIRTPGGANVPAPTVTSSAGIPTGARTAAGQPLVLGAANVVIQAIQRNQDLTTGNRGPAGVFTVVQVEIQNGGTESLIPQSADFRLVDDRGWLYAVDLEATRAVNTSTKHRVIFDAPVPPGARLATLLAFETSPDTNALSLRVKLGYGDVELPR
jgi:Domain of unknown function (DUF4352)